MTDAAGSLEIERDHYRHELWKTGRVLAVLLADAGGEITIDVARADALGTIMLDYTISDDEQQLTVRLEDPPGASDESKET